MSRNSVIIPVLETFLDLSTIPKSGLYYSIVGLFVTTTVVSTLLTAAFLVLSILLWSHFKHIRFFWFLVQLILSVFIISVSNLLIHVPATLGLLSPSTLNSEIFIFVTYLIDFSHYSIIFSNTVIAINRGVLFFKKSSVAAKTFESPFIMFWLLLIWLMPLGIDYVLMSAGCRIQHNLKMKKFRMKCEKYSNSFLIHTETPLGIQIIDTLLQIGLPAFIFLIYASIVVSIAFARNLSLKDHDKTILKQAIFTFVVFQAPSLVFMGSNFFSIEDVGAFLIKRFVNTMEIFGGIATPSFFFFTSQEVRKIMTSRVYATNSDNSADMVQRNRIRAAA
ncbi:hypothetical protein CAEBREN_28653 [Caenorhabditis brenneri]|uniref:G-protein coupled receptors family 1 profile domain-containing protein n=1 Tax=Caenorhabditis brenneri TaxID=135651 RepID=G0NF28_CAEBE|nr:hypothetical protein CAEBREN_28653 [Caenorhabditis brenneri]